MNSSNMTEGLLCNSVRTWERVKKFPAKENQTQGVGETYCQRRIFDQRYEASMFYLFIYGPSCLGFGFEFIVVQVMSKSTGLEWALERAVSHNGVRVK
ncbi:hypothetical protein VNO77_17755 [Canavalia gladiata]|uniref:Uncharacterized protein n=1 Tax=Canavalia gladiata TaxID=3824 RepID=A0AAN9LPI4_CANGL